MKTGELDYELPAELIAQKPSARRSGSRLLVLERATGRLTEARFAQLGSFITEGDCLVLNDTKVLPARFFARRQTGGKLEVLFLAETSPGGWEVMIKGSGKLRPGERLYLRDRHGADFCSAELEDKQEHGVCFLRLDGRSDALTVLQRIGYAPLPPYIKRDADQTRAAEDRRRYQTVYARHLGAIAAPTAGLHFTRGLIERLQKAGVRFAYLTLHVGVGTFKPITAPNLEEHRMHAEWFRIDADNAAVINQTKGRGGRVIAVGTTSTRALESAAHAGRVVPFTGTTDLFITPGYNFKIVDAMITNFHLPRSTLLALVAAFAGLEQILTAYRYAVQRRYRFYSYGDAMLIL